MRLPSVYAAGLVLSLLGACGDDQGPPSLAECTGPVSLVTSAGTAPTFTWTPNCRASILVVDDPSNGGTQWVLRSQGEQNRLQSPIVYGGTPSGSVTEFQPTELLAAKQYRGRVSRATGNVNQPYELIGETLFTP
jgi:hypothetical protein